MEFENRELLTRAFTHRSYLNEAIQSDSRHNERLEFLGDAVLELVTTEYLFSEYPDTPEGELTAVRAALVNTISLAETAEDLEINKYLRLSKGESQDTGRARQYILANTLEAIIGALYLDQGYSGAQTFISKYILTKSARIVSEGLWRDPKSYYQELAQENVKITPTYETIKEEGPDHDKTFTVGLYLEDDLITTGTGHSKQEAETEAAQKALEMSDWK